MIEDDTRSFLFRGLMFEAEAETFRRAGIQIGARTTEAEESLLREALVIWNASSSHYKKSALSD